MAWSRISLVPRRVPSGDNRERRRFARGRPGNPEAAVLLSGFELHRLPSLEGCRRTDPFAYRHDSHGSLAPRRSSRLLPGRARFDSSGAHRFVRTTDCSLKTSFLPRGDRPIWARRRPCKPKIRVQIPVAPLSGFAIAPFRYAALIRRGLAPGVRRVIPQTRATHLRIEGSSPSTCTGAYGVIGKRTRLIT